KQGEKDANKKYADLEKTLIDAKVPLDPAKLKEFVAAIGKSKEGYEKEIEKLTTAKVMVETKLNEVNEALSKAGVKDAKEVAGLVAMRDTLTKERDALTKERDNVINERNTLTKNLGALTKERDNLVKDTKDTSDLIENAMVALGL